ncbi:oxidoreductase [Mangrovactinospora gilvigrisea]|uniref:Oxidoreductase n=1 Tax=Mangrovactinospora gilvigrisea TaxID=1428644 RepID=A0A1J7BFZ8_9ACTN|nr:Gfo/Idh/MocA family oxidoreductase [Mangrovactinospora gilvigrisea]OIV37603.1 oxidoreductase [Mangrovactinospora gilvigrisea]
MTGSSIGIIGAGQFSRSFIPLWQAHPDVSEVRLAEVVPERLEAEARKHGIEKTYATAEELIASDVDAIAIFTQRWTHGALALAALRAGKHVYSSVPMGITVEEIEAIVGAVKETGLVYMMGETSHYNPAAVYCRERHAAGDFGRIFYAEGDYVHDMDLGFYKAYQYSGGEKWKETASFPPMLYPTHAVGGVLAVTGSHAVAVSCVGVQDDRGDGVFDREVSRWGNDFSNASALFKLNDGGAMRTNEMRRVGYPSFIRESRFRFFGTEGSFEEMAESAVWQDKEGVTDVSDLMVTRPTERDDAPGLADVDPALRAAFVSGFAPVHDYRRLPLEFAGKPNGHEGSHQFLADDFAKALASGEHPPVSAWQAARYTLPGIVAHESAKRGGEQLPVPDFGDTPQ